MKENIWKFRTTQRMGILVLTNSAAYQAHISHILSALIASRPCSRKFRKFHTGQLLGQILSVHYLHLCWSFSTINEPPYCFIRRTESTLTQRSGLSHDLLQGQSKRAFWVSSCAGKQCKDLCTTHKAYVYFPILISTHPSHQPSIRCDRRCLVRPAWIW